MVPPCSDRISRVPPYSNPYIFVTCTGLSPIFALLSRRFQLKNVWHWPGPRSLATTNGVSVDVLSSGYLDVSVPRVCFAAPMYSARDDHKWSGFPIRKSTDQSLLTNSPWLIAVCHVLHRLSMPRHSPDALTTLDRSHYRHVRMNAYSVHG